MNAGELRKLAPEELVEKVRETRDELFNSRVKHSTGQLEDTTRLKTLRREIARMESVLGEKREATK